MLSDELMNAHYKTNIMLVCLSFTYKIYERDFEAKHEKKYHIQTIKRKQTYSTCRHSNTHLLTFPKIIYSMIGGWINPSGG